MTSTTATYGGGRTLPVHAFVEDDRRDLDDGLLIQIHIALLGLGQGQILRVSSPLESVSEQLLAFEAASDHALLAVVPDPERPGWTDHFLRKGRARTDWTAGAPPAVTVQGTDADTIDSLMPRRLWLYTNYDCNLACDYCCVVAGPRVDPRRLSDERIHALVDDAVAHGFERVFLTGGEPTLRPDLPALLSYVADRLPVTVLTNAMLLRGPRWEGIRQVIAAGRPVAFQVSLDSATAELHDTHRGRGAHAKALDGIRLLVAEGAHVRLAASLPEANLGELPALHDLADELGIPTTDRIFRPIALRGAASEGEPIRPQDVAPELTYDAQGWFWHPISNDPDMRLDLAPSTDLSAALRAVRSRLEAYTTARSGRLDRFVCG